MRTGQVGQAQSDANIVCIIGAGKCGIAAARALQVRGIPFHWFEMSDRVGGLWAIDNPNQRSPAYHSLRINSSRYRSSFHDYPMPEDWPTFPTHSQIAKYLDLAVDQFGLRDQILFGVQVLRAEPDSGGGWLVETNRGSRRYHAVIVANGHHWDPNWPVAIDRTKFSGIQIHARDYRSPKHPYSVIDQRVLVVGLGNTAADIASEIALRGDARRVLLSARHGAWIIPKHVRGTPLGRLQSRVPLPWWLHSFAARIICEIWSVRGEHYGLPPTERWPLAEYPTISDDLPIALRAEKVLGRRELVGFEGATAIFSDGRRDDVDLVIWCTGYRVAMPFLSAAVFPDGSEFRLWHRLVLPDVPNLFFLGLADPVGSILEMAQAQAALVGDWLVGAYIPPAAEEMFTQIKRDLAAIRARFGSRGLRRLALEIDPYVRGLAAERTRGRSPQNL